MARRAFTLNGLTTEEPSDFILLHSFVEGNTNCSVFQREGEAYRVTPGKTFYCVKLIIHLGSGPSEKGDSVRLAYADNALGLNVPPAGLIKRVNVVGRSDGHGGIVFDPGTQFGIDTVREWANCAPFRMGPAGKYMYMIYGGSAGCSVTMWGVEQ